MTNKDILLEVKKELTRFTKKINLAIKEQSTDSRKHYAASKRGALDLKNELTKLTQDSKYKYGN
tara:strand:+ start:8674 stop:8865 length:192 start_codon:yes stop_codon:yes gene_type:complete